MSESTIENPTFLEEQTFTLSVALDAGAGEQVPASNEQKTDLEKIKALETELQTRTEERENYKNRLHAVEKELLDLKESQIQLESKAAQDNRSSEGGLLSKLKQDNSNLREALNKAAEMIKDKTALCASQERQNFALTSQISSLKEVVAITKDMLNIRNMEVKHLQADVESMELKINAERQRHNAMIAKMEEAVKLNAALKIEYENQLKIFENLKERYMEKVKFLENENKKLESKMSSRHAVHENEGITNITDVIAHVINASGENAAVNSTGENTDVKDATTENSEVKDEDHEQMPHTKEAAVCEKVEQCEKTGDTCNTGAEEFVDANDHITTN